MSRVAFAFVDEMVECVRVDLGGLLTEPALTIDERTFGQLAEIGIGERFQPEQRAA